MYEFVNRMLGGAIGAGLALVFLPSVAVFFGAKWLSDAPIVGLPLLAMFGIMILFGALSLIASLFSKLNLTDTTQALALPEGSIRAAIALSLIVLFAIIAILLNQAASQPYVIHGFAKDDKEIFVRENAQRVIAVVPVCARTGDAPTGQSSASCEAKDTSYDVHVLNPPSQQYADLSKQLLILIGTLVTSVVSFYFGSRTSEARSTDVKTARSAVETNDYESLDHDHGDITNPTPDEALPPAQGGVVS